MKVRLIQFNYKDYENKNITPYGLTIGNIYEVAEPYKLTDGTNAYTIEEDDDGDENELYDGEFEVIV